MVNNHLGDTLSTIQKKEKLDANCKKVLGNKTILAWILKGCVPEYESCTIKEICSYIEGEPEIGEIPLNPDLENIYRAEKINGLSDEDSSSSEGVIRYDVRFKANFPKRNEIAELIINVEAQNNFSPGYSLVTRGIYYCSRMISSQKQVEFTGSNYGNMKKVYSIWICMNPPSEWQNTVTAYYVQEKQIYGSAFEKKENYDKMQVVIVGLGEKTSDVDFVHLLQVLFSGESPTTKKDVLKSQFDISTEAFEKELECMCNYSDYVFDKGKLEGLAEGKLEGLAEGKLEGLAEGKLEGLAEGTVKTIITLLKKAGASDESIVKEIMEQLSVPYDEAVHLMKTYTPNNMK